MATLSSTDKASQTDSSLSAYGTARSTADGGREAHFVTELTIRP